MTKIITVTMDDNFTCKCGNDDSDSGFSPSNKEGVEVEPVPIWEGHYICNACDQVYLPK